LAAFFAAFESGCASSKLVIFLRHPNSFNGDKHKMTDFQEITSTVALAEALKSSDQQPVLFFKHSNTCGISQRAFGEFERYLESPESGKVQNCLIVVQTAREVSNELARQLSIEHESPQAILVSKQQAVWNDSHLALKSETLKAAIEIK
jgi:bacillithiol system protein YtxJ